MRDMREMKTGWVVAIAIAAGCAGEPADPNASVAPDVDAGLYVVMTRPPNVPASYVATPNGWFDPACVHRLDDGDRVLADGRVARADGSLRPATPCTSPRYDVLGRAIDGAHPLAVKPPASSGWIEYADSIATGPVSYLRASWTVPPAPTVTDATIYFFPGLENKASLNTPILQPVLGWNQYGGPAGWSLMSWDCCTQGTYYSAAIPAAAGQAVAGDLTGSSCDATGVCASWQIVSRNLSTGRTTTLGASPGLAMDYVFAGVLETYGVQICDELPASGATFSGFALRSASGAAIATPAWHTHVAAATPACGYFMTGGASVTAGVNAACSPGDDRSCCAFAGGCGCLGEETCKANGTWGACLGSTPKGTPCP